MIRGHWSILLAVALSVGLTGTLEVAIAAAPGSTAHGYAIAVAPDHPDGVYRAGEQVRFTVHVTNNGEPVTKGQIEYAVEINGTVEGQTGAVALGPGGAVVNATLDKPGCLMLTATFRTAEQAVGRDTEEALRSGADFRP